MAQIESLLFVADEPVAVSDLSRVFGTASSDVEVALTQLADACSERGVRVQRTNGRVQMVTAPESSEAIQRFLGLESSARLSSAALEVLAMVAYRQPITRPEVDALRGVNSEASLRTLMSRGLVEAVGRRPTVGHPIEYATTFLFLEYFGLTSLDDLPPVDSLVSASAGTDQLTLADTDFLSTGNGRQGPGNGPSDAEDA
jgi:segregation and condensation protein B